MGNEKYDSIVSLLRVCLYVLVLVFSKIGLVMAGDTYKIEWIDSECEEWPSIYHFGENYTDKWVETCLANGRSPNEKYRQGANRFDAMEFYTSPMHMAAFFDHRESVLALLEFGAEIDSLNYRGETPLHKAAGRGNKEMALLLLSHGADPFIVDKDGNTPIDTASMFTITDTARAIGEVTGQPIEKTK